jgi:hypothetical protein
MPPAGRRTPPATSRTFIAHHAWFHKPTPWRRCGCIRATGLSAAGGSAKRPWPAWFVRTISCRSPMLRASRSMRVTISTSPFRRKSRTVRNSARFAVLVPDLFSDRGATLPLQGVPRISAFMRSNCRPRPIVTQLSKVRLR